MKSFRMLYAFMSLLILMAAGMPYGAASAAAEPASGKTYQIGTDITFAPFEFQDASGNFVGIDMDLLDAIAKDQNFKYEVKPLGFNAAVQALEANQVDGVIAGMSITDERKQKFDFSDPYFDSGVVMAIRQDQESIKGYEDLKGKKSPSKRVRRVTALLNLSPPSTDSPSCLLTIRPRCMTMSGPVIPLPVLTISLCWLMESNRTMD